MAMGWEQRLILSAPLCRWYEHDALDIYTSVVECISCAMEKLGSKCGHEVAAIGITNQRETLVAWDKLTGAPLCPAIVWLDVRTWPQCARLKEELGGVVCTCAPQGCWSPHCSQALISPIYLGGFPVISNTRTFL